MFYFRVFELLRCFIIGFPILNRTPQIFSWIKISEDFLIRSKNKENYLEVHFALFGSFGS